MAMNQISAPNLPPGLFNATMAFGDRPLSYGRTVCGQFYGNFPDSRDCKDAIEKLPGGPAAIAYVNDGRDGPYHIPQATRSGNCMVQVELAGQGNPATFQVAPDTIRKMASRVRGVCVEGSHAGGFITWSLEKMAGWLTSPEGELDAEMPPSTSFLTVSVTTIVPEYISPGNYDPTIASVFAQAEYDAAAKMPPASRLGTKLKARGARLLKIAQVMDPRGRRIPWWSLPPNLDQAGGAAVAGSPPAPGSAAGKPETPPGGDGEAGTATARKARRRRRGGMGEEGLMA